MSLLLAISAAMMIVLLAVILWLTSTLDTEDEINDREDLD